MDTNSVVMFSKTIKVGDYIKVRYATGERLKGGTIQGNVTKVWNGENNKKGLYQIQVNNGWCCHPEDELLEHNAPEP